MTFSIRPVEAGDVEAVYAQLRQDDIEYLTRLTGDAQQALHAAFSEAHKAYAFVCDEGVAAILGYCDGNIWLQTTKLTDSRQKAVIKAGREALRLLSVPLSYCIIPTYDKRVRLLCKAMGYTSEGSAYPSYMASGIHHTTYWRFD